MSFSSGRGVNSIGSPQDLNCEELCDFCLAFLTDFRENPSTECTHGGIVGAEGISIITWSLWGRIWKMICGFKEWKMVQKALEETEGLREETWWSEVPPIPSNQHQPGCETAGGSSLIFPAVMSLLFVLDLAVCVEVIFLSSFKFIKLVACQAKTILKLQKHTLKD